MRKAEIYCNEMKPRTVPVDMLLAKPTGNAAWRKRGR